MDLNILALNEDGIFNKVEIIQKLNTAFKLGYNTVAVNVRVSGSKVVNAMKKKDSGKSSSPVPEPPDICIDDIDSSSLKLAGKNPKILSRVTFIVADANEANFCIKSNSVKNYNLLAFEVTTANIFKDACTRLEFDILCIDITKKLPFTMKRPLLQMCGRRGIFIELVYAPSIKDKMARRGSIYSAHFLVRCTHKRNFIISSGADKHSYLRSPYDVANLGTLFGFDIHSAKNAVSKNCEAVIKHAESRQLCKGVIGVQKISDLSADKAWILNEVPLDPSDKKTMKYTKVSYKKLQIEATPGKNSLKDKLVNSDNDISDVREPDAKKMKT